MASAHCCLTLKTLTRLHNRSKNELLTVTNIQVFHRRVSVRDADVTGGDDPASDPELAREVVVVGHPLVGQNPVDHFFVGLPHRGCVLRRALRQEVAEEERFAEKIPTLKIPKMLLVQLKIRFLIRPTN